jgi:predicted MFS family arabinose efflux permease
VDGRRIGTRGGESVSGILFLSLFAAQSGLIAVSPVLGEVASDLGVSTAAAGQLRTVGGLAAGLTTLLLPRAARRLGLRRLLIVGALVLAVGSIASAAATSFALLALAQVPVGVAVGLLVGSATAAAGEWAPPEAHARVLSWTLIGNPAAWIVGIPLIGLVGGASWRYGWLVLPLTAALAVAAGAARRPRSEGTEVGGGLRAALTDPVLKRWLIAEVAANSAWIGLLVYAGALFADSYETSPAATGALLALVAVAYVAGNFAFRRAASRAGQAPLIRLCLTMAVLVALVGLVRPDPAVSAVLLAAAAFFSAGRTLLSNVYGLNAAPDRRVAAMAARSAANQLGYLAGGAAAGMALAVSGYGGLGLVLGLLFVGAAAALGRCGSRHHGVHLPRLVDPCDA